jgi:hypothetical protein
MARVHDGDPLQIVLVDQLDELAEARADEHHVGRGESEGQPFRGLGVVAAVRFEGVVAELRPGEAER